MLSIHSPMNNVLIVSDELMKPYTDDESKLNGLDYKWIQFYPQSGEDITSYVETRDEDMLIHGMHVKDGAGCQEVS
mgnify:CR=1 FL=1